MKNTFCAFSLEIFLLYFLLMLTFWFCIVLFTLYIIVCVYVFNKDLNKLNVLVSLCYCCIKVLLKYYSSFTILFGWGKKPKLLFFSLKVRQEKEPWCGFSWTRSAPAHPDTALGEYFTFTSFHWSVHKIPALFSTYQDFTIANQHNVVERYGNTKTWQYFI